MWNERPPMLTGQAARDIGAIRDYLFRMSSQLTEAAAQVDAVITTDKDGKPTLRPGSAAEASIKKQAEELKSLILKTANNVKQYADTIVTNLESVYVAQSDFGVFAENISTEIVETAQAQIATYDYTEILSGVNAAIEALSTTINGEIRRGIIWDPSKQSYVLGIAISQNIEFTAETPYVDGGNEYYYIDSGQTFGLYTSTGWQFWISGVKRAWLDTVDGEMHIIQLTIEESLKMGSHWEIRHATNSWGLKFIGG